MNWIANGFCVIGCFMVITGTIHLIHHDLFIRYGSAEVEKVIQRPEGEIPGGTQYDVAFVNPISGKKIVDRWISLSMPEGAKVGDRIDVQYQTHRLDEFQRSVAEFTIVNVRNMFIVAAIFLALGIGIRLWVVSA